ncbi:hypothetical protein PAPHI01_1656 [Pancytospora philotis]|nr:hypothetical protein PAPHI01_1656 [Pancytospora philotis]
MEAAERQKRLEELRKQREELDRLIEELSRPADAAGAPMELNIPYAEPFIAQCKSAVASYTYDARTADPDELLATRLLVNKRCNQISTDYAHTAAIVAELLPRQNDALFVEILARKLLDQGRVQVSSHFESYKPLSYVMLKLGAALPSRYLQLLVVKQGGENELKGMYAVYFGYLNLAEHVSGCWLWLASVLNCEPSALSGYVVEVFLLICGELLKEKCGARFAKLVRYIRAHYIKELKNPAVETRIECILAGLEGGAKE